MELIKVHKASSQTPKKKLRQEGGTLFSKGINPCLAVFQTMLHQKPMRTQIFQLAHSQLWHSLPLADRRPIDAKNFGKLSL